MLVSEIGPFGPYEPFGLLIIRGGSFGSAPYFVSRKQSAKVKMFPLLFYLTAGEAAWQARVMASHPVGFRRGGVLTALGVWTLWQDYLHQGKIST